MVQADVDCKADNIAALEEEIALLKASIESSNTEQFANQAARTAAAEAEIPNVETQAKAVQSRLGVEAAEQETGLTDTLLKQMEKKRGKKEAKKRRQSYMSPSKCPFVIFTIEARILPSE